MARQTRLLELALKGLDLERRGIEEEVAEIQARLSGTAPAPAHDKTQPPTSKPTEKSGLTSAGRRRLSDLMKKRWAEKKKAAGKATKAR